MSLDIDTGGNEINRFTDLSALQAGIENPIKGDMAVVVDSTSISDPDNLINSNAKEYGVVWNGTDWEIYQAINNESAFIDTNTGLITNSASTYARRFADTQVDGPGRLITVANGVSQTEVNTILGLIDAEPFPGRIVSIEIGFSSTRIRAYNEGGTEFTEYINCTQGPAPKALKPGAVSKERQVVSLASGANTGIKQYLIDTTNYAVGDPVVSLVPNYTYLANGTLRLDQYNSAGNFLSVPSSINYTLGHDSTGNLRQIPKDIIRIFENLTPISVPNNGVTNYTELRSFTFTVTNSCLLSVSPTVRMSVASNSANQNQARFFAAIRINGGARIDASIESILQDQGQSVGRLNGDQHGLERNVSAGDVVEVIGLSSTNSNANLIEIGFRIEQSHSKVLI